MLFQTCEPGNAFTAAALHFHHMGYGVVRPAVERLKVERAAAGFLGAGVVAGLLQAEGEHPEQDGVARHVGGPGRQRAGNSVAQVAGVGTEEIHLVADLQRDQVARKAHAQPVECHCRLSPIAGDHLLERNEVPDLAVLEGELPDLPDRSSRLGRRVRLGRESQQMGFQEVRHGEAWRSLDRLREQGHRVAVIDIERLDRPLIERRCLSGCARKRVSLKILDHGALRGRRQLAVSAASAGRPRCYHRPRS